MVSITDPLTLSSRIHISSALTKRVGVISCIGIEFYQKAGDGFYLLEGMGCMKVANVY